MNVKIGHGGTLDPLATGVLILGIGSGTKKLGPFMTECNKQYEAVLLFGAATDTYDTEGKVLSHKPYEHVTREAVEIALQKFKGQIMQKPPIYSALRVQGKRMYEYAREGKELPIEIKERPVSVLDIEVIEWMEGGTHPWHWPEQEAELEDKLVARKALHIEGDVSASEEASSISAKRKREDTAPGPDDASPELLDKRVKTEEQTPSGQPSRSTDDLPTSNAEVQTANKENPASAIDVPGGDSTAPETATRPPCPAPACRIRMDVTSGFYVRSLCHDLGAEVGSLGIMASLVRTRQGQFKLGTNVLPFEDVSKGEEIWGPKVESLLKQWQENESKGRSRE
jgi:tRNA pseudouridine55 synthase